MTEQDAIRVVESQRRELRISSRMQVVGAERAIVEYTRDRTRPGPAEDRLAWVVTLSSSMGFVKVHVEDRSGEILEVIRSA